MAPPFLEGMPRFSVFFSLLSQENEKWDFSKIFPTQPDIPSISELSTGNKMPSMFAVVGGVAVATYVFLVALLRLTQDAKEPPLISDAVPFLTPVVSMSSKGAAFHRVQRFASDHTT
jgi:hypothetical protein